MINEAMYEMHNFCNLNVSKCTLDIGTITRNDRKLAKCKGFTESLLYPYVQIQTQVYNTKIF